MRILLAGNVGITREKLLIKKKATRLYTFFTHKPGGRFSKEFEYRMMVLKRKEKRK